VNFNHKTLHSKNVYFLKLGKIILVFIDYSFFNFYFSLSRSWQFTFCSYVTLGAQ